MVLKKYVVGQTYYQSQEWHEKLRYWSLVGRKVGEPVKIGNIYMLSERTTAMGHINSSWRILSAVLGVRYLIF